MIEKLREKYALSAWLIRIAFVVTYVFAFWYDTCGIVDYMSMIFVDFTASLWYVPLVAVVTGICMLGILMIMVSVIINFCRLYYLPKAEFTLIVTAFFVLRHLIMGVLKLLYYITPIIHIWGQLLIPLIATLICAILFYKTVKKLYLNNLNEPHFFKCELILFIVYFGVTSVATLVA
ncbi:MAG: hypothetical protein RR248_04435 [Clostridia bacterium]